MLQTPEAMPTEENQESTPLDEILNQVESYIKDPATVTPETLMSLKQQLLDLKSYMDGEDTQAPTEAPTDEPSYGKGSESGGGSLMGAMGKRGMR